MRYCMRERHGPLISDSVKTQKLVSEVSSKGAMNRIQDAP